ncbi:2-dehydropantoate 2-reductase [Sphingomonas sp. HDW15A]|uniref:ketopantoate reductase family protein n=1 Tax=Sphingomonas sp. HDW15A TaxID=2714942 RepID=UPI00140B08B6|nr:2-dehydropantoate 2-reductase [Sphingomonas sp. HDW15A]QIK96749.1 2-dehydropantoate 2-reductase [Sphingomonas sp. HDW15A]
MTITVVGGGAIGGWIAGRLALAGHEPTLLVRAGQRSSGLTLGEGDGVRQVALNVIDSVAGIGAQDVVIFAVKAFALANAAEAAARLIGPDTVIVPMINGVPWWFTNPPLASVDPQGRIGRSLPLPQVVGTVVHAAVRREGQEIRVQHADKIILGEPEGGDSDRVRRLCALFEDSGIRAEASKAVRRDIWYKAWGNMTMNPLSALTLATADRIIAECRPLILDCMEEARAIGVAIGCPITESGEDRIAVTERLGAFRTSMLQDVEAGRPIEIEALLGAPLELAARHGIPAPNLHQLYAMTRLMAEGRGLA